jgi:hypothetical protein
VNVTFPTDAGNPRHAVYTPAAACLEHRAFMAQCRAGLQGRRQDLDWVLQRLQGKEEQVLQVRGGEKGAPPGGVGHPGCCPD